jgi:hypothetical protein
VSTVNHFDGYDDAQRLRNQRKASDTAASQPRGGVTRGAPCLVLQTATKTTYPTVAGAFYACHILTVLGTETEGSAGVLTVVSATDWTYALNLGLAVPPSGTNVLATFVDSRWTFRWDG